MIDILFVVPVPPRGAARHRTRVVRTADGRAFAQEYKEAKTRSYEGTVALAAQEALGGVVIEGPVCLDLLAVMPRPKRLLRRADPGGLIICTAKPDIDNIFKAVADGMRAHWRDDAQIACGSVRKAYAERDGTARVVVRVRAPVTLDEAL